MCRLECANEFAMRCKLFFCRCTCSGSLAVYFVIPLAGLP